MAKFLQYRDGGKSDEKGISTHLYGLFQGQVTNGLAVTQDSPLGMSVLVSKGRCMIDSADDYPYLGFTDANEVVTITAADGSNPRIDAIVAYVDLSVVDSTNANNPGAFEIVAVAGTPAGSPNPPNDAAVSTAIGLGNPFIRLAHVTVGAGVTTITTGNVSDQRVFVGLPDGFVTTNALAGGAVTAEKIAQGAITLGTFYRTTDVGSAGSTSVEQYFDFSVTVDIPAGGREVEVELYIPRITGSGAINQFFSIWEGTVGSGTELQQCAFTYGGGSYLGYVSMIAKYTPTPGSKTYNVGYSVSAGSINADIASTRPGILTVRMV